MLVLQIFSVTGIAAVEMASLGVCTGSNILLAFQMDCGKVLTEENKLDFIPQRLTEKMNKTEICLFEDDCNGKFDLDPAFILNLKSSYMK